MGDKMKFDEKNKLGVLRHFEVSEKNFKFAEDLQTKFSVWSDAETERFAGIVSALQQKGFDWYFTNVGGHTGPLRVGSKNKPKKAHLVLGYLDFLKSPFVFKDTNKNVYQDSESADFVEWLKTKDGGRKSGGHWPNEYNEAEEADDESEMNEKMKSDPPLNQILYGPPGTGKTYHTIDKALEIFGERKSVSDYSSAEEARRANKKLFDERVSNGDIQFVTFHQSFSYEDFVEGLTAQVDEQTQQIRYEVSDGVFKRICESAAVNIEGGEVDFSHLKDQRVWKMSLGAANEGTEVYDACLKNNRILLGWGGDIDFSQCKNRNDIKSQYQQSEEHLADNSYAITAVHAFLLKVKKDDLIVVSDGNRKFRAIARVTGDYECLSEGVCEHYFQSRAVEWLREYKPSLPRDRLMDVDFSQMTIYEPSAIDRKKLEGLLSEQASKSERSPKVLIIDEINRGNISKIFGELITLIEPSKRQGVDEALTVTLPYSKTAFGVPDNVYIIGTMNSADRSLASLDLALRRRFDFIEMPPDANTLAGITVGDIDVKKMFETINQRIEVLLGRDYYIGHAYFLPLENNRSLGLLANIFKNKIIPLLQEYFFEDWARIAQVLNSDVTAGFIVKEYYAKNLFGKNSHPEGEQEHAVWRINTGAFEKPENYRAVYESLMSNEAGDAK
jgi:5-methylcytosine-specific restriction enzyme B